MSARPTPEHLEEHQKLTKAIAEALQHGSRIPCTGPHRGWWTSDDEAEQRRAAALCRRCPFVVPCREYGEEYEAHGVYGGTTEADRATTNRKDAAA